MPTPPTPDALAQLEREILHTALFDATAAAVVSSAVPPEAFANQAHRDLAAYIARAVEKGEPVRLELAAAAGAKPSTLADVSSAYANAADAHFLCAVLNEAHMARRVSFVAERAARLLRAGGVDAYDAVEELQTALGQAVLDAGRGVGTDVSASVGARQAAERLNLWRTGQATDYAPSGFGGFDLAIGGYPVAELTTLAAMTGAGKTSLFVQAAVAVSRRNAGAVVLFSTEMTAEQIAHRAAAQIAGTDLRRLRTGRAGQDRYDAHGAALKEYGALPIQVDDAPAPSLAHIEARLALVSAGGRRLALVGVDYDERLEVPGATEELRVSAIARGLKTVAKRHGVAVLALSQYSRTATGATAPSNDWLRYSGKKEQESAMVVHWHWPGYWVRRGEEGNRVYGYDEHHPDRGYLIVTKNRYGPEGKLALDFDPATTSFTEPARAHKNGLSSEVAP